MKGSPLIETKSKLTECASCMFRAGLGIKFVVRMTGLAKTSLRRFRKRAGLVDCQTRTTKVNLHFIQTPKQKEFKVGAQMNLGLQFDEETSAMMAKVANRAKWVSSIKTNRKRSAKAARRRYKHAIENDKSLLIASRIRTQVRHAIQRGWKSGKTEQLLGCSFNSLKLHLQSQFKDGMHWNNYGSHWHIDHIRPCASFDLKDPEQQRQCFHFSNLRPLWASENISKGSMWNGIRHRVKPSGRVDNF